MIPAAFDYEVAESVDHAVELLSTREDAKLLAGGHSLLPLMRLRVARPGTLVDVGRLGDLRYVREDGDAIAIGALTRHHDLEGDPLLRERCGLLALDAELVTHDGRRIAAADFFRGVFETALGPNDVLTEIRVPALDGAGWSFLKFRNRSQDWATVAVAAVTRNGSCAVALANMGATPLRAQAAEAAYADGGSAAAGEAAAEGTDPPEDTAASAEFRRHLARVLTRRALEEAAG
jgi:carbon-monoxide dehydrogenase medium subunit